MFGAGGTPGTQGFIGPPAALGAGFDGAKRFAKGQNFTNSVVDAMTAFMYHEDGRKKLGIMGEAGPEAIMPLLRTGQAMAVAAYARDGTRKALELTRGPDGTLGVKWPERFAQGGTFGGGRMPSRMNSSMGYGGGDTIVNLGGMNIHYTPTGDTRYDQQHLAQLKRVVEGAVDERIGVAFRKVEKRGGRLSIFGMKGSH